MTEYAEFRLRIERGSRQGSYRVEASAFGASRGGTFRRPFTDTDLENFVLKVGRTRRGVRRIESPEWDLAKTFGSKLFGALIHGPVAELYREAYAQARASKQGLRITLSLTDVPEVGAIPWEYLFDDPNFLSISTSTPVVRYLDLPHPRPPLSIELPIRILGLISAPTDYPALDTAAERAKLEAALKPLVDAGAVSIEWLEEANLLALAKRLRPDTFQILHYIGHGGFDDASGQGALLLEDGDGHSRVVSGEQLATVLHDKTSLRLVFLNSCEGARNSVDDPFSGVATSLVERDIPAVIGMQFEITDRAAVLFASEFYAMLAEGQPVDAAITEARLAIFADHNDVEWATPVLFLRVADGRLFDVTNASAIPRADPQALVARATQEAAVPAPAAPSPAPAAPSAPFVPVPVPLPAATPEPHEPEGVEPEAVEPPPAPPLPAPLPMIKPGDTSPGDATSRGDAPSLGFAADAASPGDDAPPPTGWPQVSAIPGARPRASTTRSVRRHWRPIALVAVVAVVLVVAAVRLLQPPETPVSPPVLSVSYPGPGVAHLHGYGFAANESVYVGLNRDTITDVPANYLGWIDRDFAIGDLESGLFTAVSESGRTAEITFRTPIAGSPGPSTSGTPSTPAPGSPGPPTDPPSSAAVGPTVTPTPAAPATGCDSVTPAPVVANPSSPGILLYTHIKRGETGNRWIYLMAGPGTRPVPLSDGTTDDTYPAWSPDHTRIVFSRNGRIHVGSLGDGAIVGAVPLTEGPGDSFPAWSANDCIAFVRKGSGIWRVNPNGGDATPVGTSSSAGAPDWSPDGLTLAYMGRQGGQVDIFTIRRGEKPIQLKLSGVDDVTPKWSPDGTRIAYAQGAAGTNGQDIYVVSVEANRGTQLARAQQVTDTPDATDPAVRDSNPAWSPTGDRIVFYRGSTRTEDYRLYLMDYPSASEKRVQLTPDSLGPVLDPAWR